MLSSGTFSPGPSYGSLAKRVSHRYLIGMLLAGNIRLEMHETIQEPGALHEPVDTHKHNEIWLVQRGSAVLFINGVEHRMEAGDVGLVTAGDKHWVKECGVWGSGLLRGYAGAAGVRAKCRRRMRKKCAEQSRSRQRNCRIGRLKSLGFLLC